jgi:glycosyltransferase involved in cell wall biosynthesis
MHSQRKIRILQAVGRMDRYGVETWLMHILRQIDSSYFHVDFLVHTLEPCDYDDEIRSLGSHVIPCLEPHRLWAYAKNFKTAMQQYGPYDIIHTHNHHFGGVLLQLACQAQIPYRIVHCHSDTTTLDQQVGYLRKSYLNLTKRWIHKQATAGLAVSREAASCLFGSKWPLDPRWQVLHTGIELQPFKQVLDSNALRASLGIPSGSFVVGHVGRFTAEKNHRFILEIFHILARVQPRSHLLLIGDGPLQSTMKAKAVDLGLQGKISFLGARQDVPGLMLGAIDVFVLPSIYEGLPLVLIEAQAAGLPCIISQVITTEADIVNHLVTRLSLSEPLFAWVNAILRPQLSVVDKQQALNIVAASSFNITQSYQALEKLYLKWARINSTANPV